MKAKPCRYFRDVFEAVKLKTVAAAVVPVENSLEGSMDNEDHYFFNYDLKVCGTRTTIRIEHCLIVNPGTKIYLRLNLFIYRQALAQCRSYLKKVGWIIVPAYDTAGSVKIIKEEKRLNAAAIASQRAAEIYGMQILAKDIADNKITSPHSSSFSDEDSAPTGKDKTSIIFSAKHEPGSLYNAIGEFAKRNINLTRIESRPTKKTAWEQTFDLDTFEGHRTQQKCTEALKALEKYAIFVKILGSYPKAPV